MTKRQLTVREKLLLGLLAVTALVSGYLMLFYNPMLQKRDRMRAEIETCQSQLELAQIRVAEKQRMERELKELFEKDPPPRSLAPYDNSQAVMLELHGILSAAEDYSLAFSTVEAEESIVRRSISLTFTHLATTAPRGFSSSSTTACTAAFFRSLPSISVPAAGAAFRLAAPLSFLNTNNRRAAGVTPHPPLAGA